MSKLFEFLSSLIPNFEFPININFDFSKNDFSKNLNYIKYDNNLQVQQENKINKKIIIKNKLINLLKSILVSGILIIPFIILMRSYLDLITYPFLEIFNLIDNIPSILFFSSFIIFFIIFKIIFDNIHNKYSFFIFLISILGMYLLLLLSIKYIKGE